MSGLSPARCAVHTKTLKQCSLIQCCDLLAREGFAGVGVWRDSYEDIGPEQGAKVVREHGLVVPSIVRGGFFVSPDAEERAAAIDETKRCIDEAAEFWADSVVLVVGSRGGVPLAEGRAMVKDAIETLVPHAEANSVTLAIEPLHPMYAGDKSCINRVREAREICEAIDSKWVSIAVDVYHTWWDPDIAKEIEAAGTRISGFHACDWMSPTSDMLNDRGLPGEGVIPVRQMRESVEAAGFDGLVEIEVFSNRLWALSPEEMIERTVASLAHC